MKQIPERELAKKRPIPFYYITTHDPEELTYEKFYEDLSDMKEKGYGGVVLFNRPPGGFNRDLYFTEAWFSMVGNCIRACHDLGLRLWLNDDYDAPPGDIGGRLEKIAPHLKPLRLRLEGEDVKVEVVSWGFPAYEHPESPIFFQKYVYEEYKRRYGQYFGNTIIGFFSDADSRRVNSNVYNTDSPMKDYFPWTETFAQTFEESYGYDIVPYLPSIIRRESSKQSHDYWEHNCALYMNWFASNYKWCQVNGLEYTFHTSDTAPYPVTTTYFNSAFAEGKAIDAGQHCDWPGTDHEDLGLNGAPWVRRDLMKKKYVVYGAEEEEYRRENFYDTYADLRAKQAQSSAYLYDKSGVMCEMYAGVSWYASYKDLRNIASWQFMQGVNFVVYQAYHYRLKETTKHFAPLAFSRHSHVDFTIREYNDWIAQTAYICAQGKLKVDVALLDPTDAIWEGTGDSPKELELAKKFHHLPNGFVISDMKGIRRKASELRAVVNPGLPLTEAEKEEIRSLGLKLYEYEDADKVEKELPCGISWDGEGRLMFMRRTLEDGSELLIVGNIESDDTLKGTLTFSEKEYEIELTSGEMAFFGGGFDSYRKPVEDKQKLMFPEEAEVTYNKPNLLPLIRWENEEGTGVTLKKPEKNLSYTVILGWIKPFFEAIPEKSTLKPVLPFKAEADLRGLELLIPYDVVKRILALSVDGQNLESKDIFVFDDVYKCYAFDVKEGEHKIELELSSLIGEDQGEVLHDTANNLYLRGDFDVHMEISGKKICSGGASITRLITEYAKITLSKRRRKLKTGCSWTSQGQAFYSGVVDYSFDVMIPEEIEEPILVIPDMHDPVKVYVDGNPVLNVPCKPYRIPLEVSAGKHKIVLSVCNTLGNMFDCFRMSSGLLTVPYITSGK